MTKRPRHYAMAWLKAKTDQQRQEAIAGLPEDWKPLVRAHIHNMRNRRKRETWSTLIS